ncbi:MAG TPA: hypothetical protein VK255_01375, partial [Patescibacteria group bacterium]|nr:hypothetical protein [Patescibacteria group bacterium]
MTFKTKITLYISILFLSTIGLVNDAHAAWYNASWGYRVKVTVNAAQVPSTQTNFPVYVNLANLPAGFFSHVRSDGGDIRITKSDGTTELPREVVSINVGSTAG